MLRFRSRNIKYGARFQRVWRDTVARTAADPGLAIAMLGWGTVLPLPITPMRPTPAAGAASSPAASSLFSIGGPARRAAWVAGWPTGCRPCASRSPPRSWPPPVRRTSCQAGSPRSPSWPGCSSSASASPRPRRPSRCWSCGGLAPPRTVVASSPGVFTGQALGMAVGAFAAGYMVNLARAERHVAGLRHRSGRVRPLGRLLLLAGRGAASCDALPTAAEARAHRQRRRDPADLRHPGAALDRAANARLDADMFRMMHEMSGQPSCSVGVLLPRPRWPQRQPQHRRLCRPGARPAGARGRLPPHDDPPRTRTVIIGADWFQWNDEPPSGRANDGEDANFGVVDIDDRRTTSGQLRPQDHPAAQRPSRKDPTDDGHEIWRESFADKPVARVPYLPKRIRLNGELSDWPSRTRECQGVPPLADRRPRTLQAAAAQRLPRLARRWRLPRRARSSTTTSSRRPPRAGGGRGTTSSSGFPPGPSPATSVSYDAVSVTRILLRPQQLPRRRRPAGIVGQMHRDGRRAEGNLIPHPAHQAGLPDSPRPLRRRDLHPRQGPHRL